MNFSSPQIRHLFLMCWLPFVLFPYSSFAQDDIVSVRLLREAAPRTIIISSTHPIQLFSGTDANPILELAPREKLTLTTSNDRVYLTSSEGSIFATQLLIVPPEGDKSSGEIPETTIEIPDRRALISPRSYNGAFKIDVEETSAPTLRIINYLPLEDYVVSVLASEFGFNSSDALQGAEAMALCIRTLTIRQLISQSGPEYAVPDNESWQAYKGTGPITQTAQAATLATQGQVLLYEDQLIESVYFASSGGFTANNEDVWNASEIVPYLRGVEDIYDIESPHHTWQNDIPRTDLLAHLSDVYEFSVNGISITDVSRRDQRVRSIKLSGPGNESIIIPGNEFRHAVNRRFGRDFIKSTMFKINTQSNRYLFSGGGFGHGVGLSQEGALEMSRQGFSHQEIIQYYYGDVVIDSYLPGMATPPDAMISSNVPSVDISQPEIIQPDPQFDVLAPQEPVDLPEPGARSYSGGLYGDNEDSAEFSRAINDIETAGDLDEPTGEGTEKNQKISTADKIIGWTTTTKPAAGSDSTRVKVKTKRRTTGW